VTIPGDGNVIRLGRT